MPCTQCDIGYHGDCDPESCDCFCHDQGSGDTITPEELENIMKQLRQKLQARKSTPPKMTEVFKLKETVFMPAGTTNVNNIGTTGMGAKGKILSAPVDASKKVAPTAQDKVRHTPDGRLVWTSKGEDGKDKIRIADTKDGEWIDVDQSTFNKINTATKGVGTTGNGSQTGGSGMSGGGGTM